MNLHRCRDSITIHLSTILGVPRNQQNCSISAVYVRLHCRKKRFSESLKMHLWFLQDQTNMKPKDIEENSFYLVFSVLLL